ADRCGEVVVLPDLAEVLVVDLDRERSVALSNQHRGSEVGERAHEHQQRGSQQGGYGQANHHLPDPLQPGASHQRRGFQQRTVHASERGVHVDRDQWEKLQAEYQDDPAETVDAAYAERQDRFQNLGGHRVAAEQQNPRVGADEWSRHTGQDCTDEQELRATQLEEGIEVRERHADQQRDYGDSEADHEAVADGAEVVVLREELGEVREREAALSVEHRLLEHTEQGVEQEQSEEQEKTQGRRSPDVHPEDLAPARLRARCRHERGHDDTSATAGAVRRVCSPALSKMFTLCRLMSMYTVVPGSRASSNSDSWIASTPVPSAKVRK